MLLRYWDAPPNISISILDDKLKLNCPVGWGCKIHRLHFCRGIIPPNECLAYDTKQSDGEVPVMQEVWGMRSTPSFPSLLGPLCPGVVVPEMLFSIGQIELNSELILKGITWNRTVLIFKLRTFANWTAWNRTVFTFNCV